MARIWLDIPKIPYRTEVRYVISWACLGRDVTPCSCTGFSLSPPPPRARPRARAPRPLRVPALTAPP
eukprot:4686668-Prymnesium_polylepis.1